jgi:hypothetical protein
MVCVPLPDVHRKPVVEGMRRVLGPQHPGTLGAMKVLADILRAQEDPGENT